MGAARLVMFGITVSDDVIIGNAFFLDSKYTPMQHLTRTHRLRPPPDTHRKTFKMKTRTRAFAIRFVTIRDASLPYSS